MSVDDVRELPDYDGREDPGPSVGEVLLWVPRVLFFPVYLALEYGLRTPAGLLITATERNEVPDKLARFFRFGDRDQIVLAPIFSIDFGFRPNIGLGFTYEGLTTEGHDLHAEVAFGGVDWWLARVETRYTTPDERLSVGLQGSYITRADLLFYDLGLQARDERESGYSLDSWDASVDAAYRVGERSMVGASFAFRDRAFGEGACPPQISERVASGEIEEPHGYVDGYTALTGSVRFVVDTRESRPEPGSGLRLSGEFNLGADPSTDDVWARYGGAITAYFDLTGYQHTISTRVQVEFVDALGGETPFSELIFLGGTGPMSGFLQGRLSGASGAAAVFEYTWPIWFFAEGKVHVAVGNVFGQQLEGFTLRDLRLSAGIGLAAVAQREQIMEFMIGFGTDTFDRGTSIESLRLMIGATREF